MKKDKRGFPAYEDDWWEFDDVVSSTECTGLIPSPPTDAADAESYTDLYDVPQPEEDYPPVENRRR